MTLAQALTKAATFHKIPTTVIADVTEHAYTALAEYSSTKPYRGSVIVAGNSTGEYDLETIVSGWSVAHEIRSIRHPVGSVYERELLPGLEWTAGFDSTNDPILKLSIPSTEYARIEYICSHTLDGSGSTIPAADESAFAHLIAAVALEAAANSFAIKSTSSIAGDSVEQNDQTKAYSFQATEERKIYDRMMAKSITGQSSTFSWPGNYNKGRGRMFDRTNR